MLLLSRGTWQCYFVLILLVYVSDAEIDQDAYALQMVAGTWTYLPTLSNWFTNGSVYGNPCSWKGVSCDPLNGRVNALNLGFIRIQGTLNKNILNLPYLETLDLSHNNLTGILPPLGSKLAGQEVITSARVKVLDLRYNQFSGPIPESLQNLPLLSKLNLSYNNFTGIIPPSLFKFDCSCFLGNPYLNITNCNSSYKSSPSSSEIFPTLPLALSLGLGIFLAISIFASYFLCYKMRKNSDFEEEDIEGGVYFPRFQRYTYRQLALSTHSFSPFKAIWEGTESTMYRAVIDGIEVGIKRSNLEPSDSAVEKCEKELQILSTLVHSNVLSLIGYCIEENCPPCLVFPLLAEGHLACHLRDGKSVRLNPLEWEIRKTVALDLAQALKYLHEGIEPPVLHGAIRSSNIFLDENFNAKLFDFGSSFSDKSYGKHKMFSLVGLTETSEQGKGVKPSKKVDVYSFGVVLLELVSGCTADFLMKKVSGEASERKLHDWVLDLLMNGTLETLIDEELQVDSKGTTFEEMKNVISLALVCLSPDPTKRPKMSKCVAILEGYQDAHLLSISTNCN